MRILLLHTGPAVDLRAAREWPERLGLDGSDDVLLVCRNAPAEPLSVTGVVTLPPSGLLGGRGVSTTFAAAAVRSARVRAAFAGADVVVPLDAGSHRAAWLLARAIPGPDVVVTDAAASRRIAAHRRHGHGGGEH